MGAAPAASLVLMVIAVAWSVALWRQLRDWRGGIFTAMIAAMAAHQATRVVWPEAGASHTDSWRPEDMHLLVESLLAALAVGLLDIAVRGRLSMLERLGQQRAIMARAEELAGSGSWTWEASTDQLTWSRGMHRLHGVDPKSFTPTMARLRELVAEEDRERFDGALQGESEAHIEHRIVRPGGESRILRTDVSVVRNAGGETIRLHGAAHDVTSQRAAEDALRSSRDKAEAAAVSRSSFLASMSHEIRTPMTAILGYADLLLDPDLGDDDRREYVETIRASGAHLLGLLDDVLDLSKIEAGRLTVESIDTDCAAVAGEVERLFRPRAKSRGLALVVMAPDEPVVIRTDPTRLRQILMNLVGNAIKFTDRGRVVIRIEADRPIGRRQPVRIAVADTGVGMSPEQQAQIFEPFRQASQCTTRRFGGTGLGLSICQRLAQLLGGEVGVESEPGHGSVFTLELFAEQGNADLVTHSRRAPTASSDADNLHGRVLLVEDAEVNRRLFRTLLSRLGLEVSMAADGAQAMEAAEAARRAGHPFDLILMDVEMPVMDGLEATKRLRASGHATPIIALTAHAMAGDRERCIAAGCSDHLPKPVDRSRLRAVCAHWLATPPMRASA